MGRSHSPARAAIKGVFASGIRVGEAPPIITDRDPSCRISVTPKLPRPRCVRYRQLPFGSVDGLVPICRDANDQRTQVEGLSKRLCSKCPEPNRTLLRGLRAFVRKWVRSNLRPLGAVPSFDEWLAACPYPQVRKDELRAVWEANRGRVLSPKVYRSSRKVKAFIKSECYPEIKAARWICSRVDLFKVLSGPAFKAIEHEVFSLPWFVKHVPVPERPALVRSLRAGGCRYIWTDYTSFEASISSELMDACECELYRYMLQCDPELAEFICAVITGRNEVSTRAGVHLTLRGRRMSGDMCTSLGNGFTNLMAMLFAAKCCGSKCRGFVEGDDGIFAFGGVPPSSEWFAKLGLKIKLAEIADPSHAGFCGVVAAEGGNIRDPVHFLQSFGWTLSSIYAGEKTLKSLLRAKALSVCYETPQCPIVGAVARRALELTRGVVPRFVADGYHAIPHHELAIPRYEPDQETRALFARLYHVPEDVQVELERRVMTAHDIRWLGREFPASHANLLFERMCVGPQQP